MLSHMLNMNQTTTTATCNRPAWKAAANPNDAKCALAAALAAAVDEYALSILEGLFGLTDEEKEERIAEFRAKYEPVNGSAEEIAVFEQRLLEFTQALHAASQNQSREMLIKPAGAAQEEMNCIANAIRLQITSPH